MTDGPPLSRLTFDRAAHHRTDDAWLAAAWPQCRVVAITPKSATPTNGSHAAYRSPGSVPDDAPRPAARA